MALSPCNTTVDEAQRELVEHGTVSFPIAFYHDDLGEGEVPWHWHEEWEAVVIASGCCIVTAGQERYTIGPGEGFFINSGVLHGCWDLKDSGCRFHSMVFHPRLVGGSLDSACHQRYVEQVAGNRDFPGIHLKPDVPWQKSALEAIERAWQLGLEEPWGYELRVRNALSELTLFLAENIPGERQSHGTKALRDGQRIKQMLLYIHDHWTEPLDTAAIAASAAVSQSEALRCFRTTIGTTPIRYVRQYRISQAAQMLTSTDAKIADVAMLCGFSDVSYFTKTFRELKGCTPLEYRRATHGNACAD